ncbi:silent information regulator family protein [Pelomyxa schiedti]|nr:silent information regulator family protein [Pelomyxa schiedti]
MFRKIFTVTNRTGHETELSLAPSKLNEPSASLLVSRCTDCTVHLPSQPPQSPTPTPATTTTTPPSSSSPPPSTPTATATTATTIPQVQSTDGGAVSPPTPTPPPTQPPTKAVDARFPTSVTPGPKAAKLIVENCKNTTVIIDVQLLSGTADLISLSGCTVEFRRVVPTLQIDGCTNLSVKLAGPWFTAPGVALISAKNTNLRLLLGEIEYAVPDHDVQQITKLDCGRLVTCPAVWDGAGYPTTQKEKEFQDAKMERLEQLMEERLRGLTTISAKPKPATTTPPATTETKPIEETPKPTDESPKPTPATQPAESIPPPSGLFSAISKFDAAKLKPTTTHVTHENVVFNETRTPTGYGHADGDDITEYFDEPAVLDKKIQQLAELVKNSHYMVIYTGAGISTSAKIPDYRGPEGVWTKRDKGETVTMKITLEEAMPTRGHMAIAKLVELGTCKFVVSTNVDGLHRRSGVPKANIAEVHGNCYLERCNQCEAEYMRTFDVMRDAPPDGTRHQTSRLCTKCSIPLQDSIVHFGEALPETELANAQTHSKAADLALVLGTSMMVQPACLFPLMARRMVICNLQKTRYDSRAQVVLHARTDIILEKLLVALGIEF